MKTTRRVAGVLAAAIVALATDVTEAQLASSRVRDSAGIQIVENPARETAPVVFRIGTTPILDVGGLQTNPDNEFSENTALLHGALLRSGGIAVADRSRIVFFDQRGRRLQSVGRLGSGPNEFREISMVCVTRGDTLIVADGALSRYTIVAPSGSIVRSFQRNEARFTGLGSGGCFDNGSIIAAAVVRGAKGVDVFTPLTFSSDNRVVVTLPTIPSASSIDFVTQPIVSLFAKGKQIYFGDGLRSEFRVFDSAGKLLRIVRSADSVSALTTKEVEEQLNATIPRNVSAAERTKRLARLRSLSSRSTWPAYLFIMTEPSGRVWMQAHKRSMLSPFSTDNWAAFDSSGKLEGRLVMPPNLLRDRFPPVVVGFGNSSVLIRRIDDDGASHLTLYPIVRLNGNR